MYMGELNYENKKNSVQPNSWFTGLPNPLPMKKDSRYGTYALKKEGASWYLRVFIDKDSGVTIDDCEALSRPLSDLLDEKRPY